MVSSESLSLIKKGEKGASRVYSAAFMAWTALAINLLFAGPVAFWTYSDAKGRDANPILWAATALIVGLFFLGPLGPVGTAIVLIIYLLVRPKGAMRICPYCKKKALHWLAFCPHCKSALKRDCYRCFAAVDVEEEFCPHCHTKLS